MVTIEQNIQGLARAVLSEARAEADQTLADARARAEAVKQQAQSRAETVRETILTRAQQQSEELRSRAVASAQLKARRLQLERREVLLGRVFETVQQRLPALQKWTDYPDIVEQLVREGVAQLKADVVRVYADGQTMALLDDARLQRLSQALGIDVQRGEVLEQGTGVILETIDGHRQFDNTLEARLLRMRDELRAAVYRLLMGEAL
jgi:V/A-type H+-transporting ATPase subunit E